MKTKLFFSTLTMAAAMAVAPAVFADEGSASVDYEYEIPYQRSSAPNNGSFKGIGIEVSGTVDNFTLQGDDSGADITGRSVVFIGSGATDETTGNLVDSITITDANIDNGEYVSGYDSTTDVFAVEGCTVIIDGTDGVTINDLGMSLTVGTMYGVGDAELVITNGAQVITGAIYDTVGSNLATGTITITGTGSLLADEQITLGGGVNSLFAADASIVVDGDYQVKWFVNDDTYATIRNTLVSSEFDPKSGSYGIVNVKEGGTWEVGVGDTNSSNNRIQLANGEINIDGKGSQLILGKNSSLLMMNESLFSDSTQGATYPIYTGMNLSETITITNGGKVLVENGEDGNAGTLYELVIGETFVADNVTAVVSVDGSDDEGNASSFVLSTNETVYIGASSGYWSNTSTGTGKYDGGTADVTVSATNGGIVDISSANGFAICADNYASYIGAMTDRKIYTGDAVGHSYGLKVAITAESGGSIELNAENGSTVMLAAGSPFEGDYKNTLTVTADGEGSSVTISGGDIYTNYGNDGTEGAESVSVEITATNGGTIALKAATVDGTGTGTISLGTNTSVTVENGSSLTTEGTVVFNSGASASVDATSTWATGATDAITFASGSSLTISIGADAVTPLADKTANVSLGAVTIAEGGSVYVVIDVSSLEAGESATVAVLSAESVTLNGTALTDGDVTELAAGYFTADEKGYTLNSWTWSDSDKTLYANVTATPEPSMFGLFFGLATIGLVATRRRRRRH